jgi:Protein of unknown function (DUF998)
LHHRRFDLGGSNGREARDCNGDEVSYQALPAFGALVWGPGLIALVDIGLIGAGIFVTDPLNGYPPGTSLIPAERTTHGILHDLLGIPFLLGLPITSFVFARLYARWGKRGWAAYSALSGFAMCSFSQG